MDQPHSESILDHGDASLNQIRDDGITSCYCLIGAARCSRNVWRITTGKERAGRPNGNTNASLTQFAYDTKGELTQITNPLNNATTLTYTSVGLIATIKDAQNNVTTYGYDTHGNRTSVTDALNHQTTFDYDTGDRLKRITYPDTTTTIFGYDSRGRRTSVTVFVFAPGYVVSYSIYAVVCVLLRASWILTLKKTKPPRN